MGRKPIGERAMTAAERQQKRRQQLGIGGPWLPTWRPWDGARSDNRAETDTIERIEDWLQYGDREAVTKWLASCLASRGDLDELDKVLTVIRDEFEHAEREAIEDEAKRLEDEAKHAARRNRGAVGTSRSEAGGGYPKHRRRPRERARHFAMESAANAFFASGKRRKSSLMTCPDGP